MSKLFLAAVLSAGAIAGFFVIRQHFFPPERAGVRVIVSDANDMIVNHADDVQDQMNNTPYKNSKGRVDLNAWSDSRLPLADEVADAQNRREATIARADRRSTAQPVRYTQSIRPWADCIPFYEPLFIEATGYVKNLRRRVQFSEYISPRPASTDYESVGPDGTFRQLPSERSPIGSGYALPLSDDQRFLAFIGRVAHAETRQPLTDSFFIGSNAVLDPTVIGASGCLQTAVNQNHSLAADVGGWFNYNFRPASSK
jgi:hypothetical protein